MIRDQRQDGAGARRQRRGEQQITLPPPAPERHEVRDESIDRLDQPGDGCDREEHCHVAGGEPAVLEDDGDRLVGHVPHALGEVDDGEQEGEASSVGSLEGVQPSEAVEHPGRNDTLSVMFSMCPHDCPSACSLVVDRKSTRLTEVTGNPDRPFTQGVICGKVRAYAERVHSPLRVLRPLKRVGPKGVWGSGVAGPPSSEGAGEFTPISWDEALATIVARWRAIIAESGA